MVDRSDSGRSDADESRKDAPVTTPDVNDWFVKEILPLEGLLMQLLYRYLRDANEAADARQDIYLKVYEAARAQLPDAAKPFLLTTARNHVIDRIRHSQVVSIEAVGDLDRIVLPADEPGPERIAASRSELNRLRKILDRLAPRCREAMVFRKIEGLSRREIAARMGISEAAVAQHLAAGMRAVVEELEDPGFDRGEP